MTDRELLELAAKAAAYTVAPHGRTEGAFLVLMNNDGDFIWNPLEDDGDALRLACALGIFIAPKAYQLGSNIATPRMVAVARFNVDPSMPPNSTIEVDHKDCDFDISVATRRAIVIAAAEIGKGM
jgi:hypothetical protein